MTVRAVAALALVVGCGGAAPRPLAPSLGALRWQHELDLAPPVGIHGVDLVDGVAIACAAGAAGGELIAFAAGATADAGGAAGAGAARWRASLSGPPRACRISGSHAVVAVGGNGTIDHAGAAVPLRGEPGAALLAFDLGTGAARWALPIGSTEWVTARAVAAAGADLLVVGSFAGTLRVGDRVVSSAGGSDGFVARVGADGTLAWLRRLGGDGGDAATAVTVAGDAVLIAGSFSGDAELGDLPLRIGTRSVQPDAFVARLALAGGTPSWAAGFGSIGPEAVAGVAVAGGEVVVASTLRGPAAIGAADVAPRGELAVLVSRWGLADGSARGAVTLDADGGAWPTALVAAGDVVWLGVTFRGHAAFGGVDVHATGEDAVLLALQGSTVVTSRALGGDGREELVALAADGATLALGLAHTADVRGAGVAVPPPDDPAGGAALLVLE